MSMVHSGKTDSKKSPAYVFPLFLFILFLPYYSRVWSDGGEINKNDLPWDNVIISYSVFNILGLCLFYLNFFTWNYFEKEPNSASSHGSDLNLKCTCVRMNQ